MVIKKVSILWREYHLSGLQHLCQPFLSRLDHCRPFSYFQCILNIFQNILTPLSGTYLGSPRNIVPRIKRGCFQHPPFKQMGDVSSECLKSVQTLSYIKVVGVKQTSSFATKSVISILVILHPLEGQHNHFDVKTLYQKLLLSYYH